jgi:hypothetical protein
MAGGLGLARPAAVSNILGLSPAPVMNRHPGSCWGRLSCAGRTAAGAGKTPAVALEVIDSPEERARSTQCFSTFALEAALNFTRGRCISQIGRAPLADRYRHRQ